MRKKFLLFFVLSILAFCAFGQQKQTIKNNEFAAFLNKFPKEKLPVCVNYSSEEQSYFDPGIAGEDSELIEDGDTSFYEYSLIEEKQGPFPYDTSKMINETEAEKYLLPEDSILSFYDPENNALLYTENKDEYLDVSEFYPVAIIAEIDKYIALIYNRVFNNNITSSEKFLCTISRSGKYISRVEIGSLAYSGTGISNHGIRIPWFPEESGCIDKNFIITFTDYKNDIKKYKILPDGKIEFIK